MAMLDIINIPAILGRETHSFKRANVYDKLDLGLAATIGRDENGFFRNERVLPKPNWDERPVSTNKIYLVVRLRIFTINVVQILSVGVWLEGKK